MMGFLRNISLFLFSLFFIVWYALLYSLWDSLTGIGLPAMFVLLFVPFGVLITGFLIYSVLEHEKFLEKIGKGCCE